MINLEDTESCGEFVNRLQTERLFGACLKEDGSLSYTGDSQGWFDLSLISRFGRKKADELKCLNRRTYQDLLFDGLGPKFEGEPYVLPKAVDTGVAA